MTLLYNLSMSVPEIDPKFLDFIFDTDMETVVNDPEIYACVGAAKSASELLSEGSMTTEDAVKFTKELNRKLSSWGKEVIVSGLPKLIDPQPQLTDSGVFDIIPATSFKPFSRQKAQFRGFRVIADDSEHNPQILLTVVAEVEDEDSPDDMHSETFALEHEGLIVEFTEMSIEQAKRIVETYHPKLYAKIDDLSRFYQSGHRIMALHSLKADRYDLENLDEKTIKAIETYLAGKLAFDTVPYTMSVAGEFFNTWPVRSRVFKPELLSKIGNITGICLEDFSQEGDGSGWQIGVKVAELTPANRQQQSLIIPVTSLYKVESIRDAHYRALDQ